MVCFTVDFDTAAAACVWWRRDKLTRCVSAPWSPGWTSRRWGRSPSSGRSRKCRSRLCRLPSSQPAFRSGRRRAPGHTPRWRKAPAKQARVHFTDGAEHRPAPTEAPPWNPVVLLAVCRKDGHCTKPSWIDQQLLKFADRNYRCYCFAEQRWFYSNLHTLKNTFSQWWAIRASESSSAGLNTLRQVHFPRTNYNKVISSMFSSSHIISTCFVLLPLLYAISFIQSYFS